MEPSNTYQIYKKYQKYKKKYCQLVQIAGTDSSKSMNGLEFFDQSIIPELNISKLGGSDTFTLSDHPKINEYIKFIVDQLPENPSLKWKGYLEFEKKCVKDLTTTTMPDNDTLEILMSDLMFRVYQITVMKTSKSPQGGSADHDRTCAICLDNLYEDNVKTACGHWYHTGCINEWLTINNICPVCRRHNPRNYENPEYSEQERRVRDWVRQENVAAGARRWPLVGFMGGLLALSMILEVIYMTDLNIRRPSGWRSDILNLRRDMGEGREAMQPLFLVGAIFDLVRNYRR